MASSPPRPTASLPLSMPSSPSSSPRRTSGGYRAKPITLGVCAMAKKTRAEPMQAILSSLRVTGDFHIIIFTDEMVRPRSRAGKPKDRSISLSVSLSSRLGTGVRVSRGHVCVWSKQWTDSRNSTRARARVCVCVNGWKILEEPVTSWPVVDALISFFSKGYALRLFIRVYVPCLSECVCMC